MHEFAPVVVSLVIIAGGIIIEWYIERLEPLLSVSRLTKTLVLGVVLGGPFVLEDLGLLPAPDGWDLVAALALVLVLYIFATRLVGVPGGIGSSGDGAGGSWGGYRGCQSFRLVSGRAQRPSRRVGSPGANR